MKDFIPLTQTCPFPPSQSNQGTSQIIPPTFLPIPPQPVLQLEPTAPEPPAVEPPAQTPTHPNFTPSPGLLPDLDEFGENWDEMFGYFEKY